jgi:hypothetical protein
MDHGSAKLGWRGYEDNPPAGENGRPVRAGMPYPVGERASEIFVPSVSGSILPTQVLRAAMAASALAAPVTAEGTQDIAPLPVSDQRPALNAPTAAPKVINKGDHIAFTIYAAPGKSAEEIV